MCSADQPTCWSDEYLFCLALKSTHREETHAHSNWTLKSDKKWGSVSILEKHGLLLWWFQHFAEHCLLGSNAHTTVTPRFCKYYWYACEVMNLPKHSQETEGVVMEPFFWHMLLWCQTIRAGAVANVLACLLALPISYLACGLYMWFLIEYFTASVEGNLTTTQACFSSWRHWQLPIDNTA